MANGHQQIDHEHPRSLAQLLKRGSVSHRATGLNRQHLSEATPAGIIRRMYRTPAALLTSTSRVIEHSHRVHGIKLGDWGRTSTTSGPDAQETSWPSRRRAGCRYRPTAGPSGASPAKSGDARRSPCPAPNECCSARKGCAAVADSSSTRRSDRRPRRHPANAPRVCSTGVAERILGD